MPDESSKSESPRPARIPRKAEVAPPVSRTKTTGDVPLRSPNAQVDSQSEAGPVLAATDTESVDTPHRVPTAPPSSMDVLPADASSPVTTIEVHEDSSSGSFFFFTAVPSWLTSVVLHVVLLLLLTMLSFPAIMREKERELVIGTTEESVEELDDFLEEPLDSFDIDDVKITDEPIVSDALQLPEEPQFDMPTETNLTPAAVSIVDPLGMAASAEALLDRQIVADETALSGRTAESRARMVREGGGTEGSEAAVANALKWLAEHQMPDGGWMLDHTVSICQGRCSHPGSKTARFGATGLALLPFLGAGNTHQEGAYKEVVSRGLQFLLKNMELRGQRARLVDAGGNYYSHGLCAIAFCEAFAMTQDRELMVPAQLLINETVFAQDPIGGGWRYKAHQPGDTSAVGWQLMALKSAHMAYLQVPRITVQKTSMFLDSVQQDDGATYGYQDPGNRRGTTSVGLLCRMYLGWDRDHEPLQRGVEYLAKKGPSKTDIYMNYYATQVMRHYGGEPWEKWNKQMRDFLVAEQSVKGHEEGSWMFVSGTHHIEAGGRLYCTSLATMILEVYYRHMPLYKKDATEDEFPL